MRFHPLVAGLVVFCLLLAGCADDAPVTSTPAPVRDLVISAPDDNAGAPPGPVPTLAAEANVTLEPGAALSVRLGTGWGRLVITPVETMRVSIVLKHNVMEDLDIFSDDGDEIYLGNNYTFITLGEPGHVYYDEEHAWYYEWWGTPEWAIWPGGTDDEQPALGSMTLKSGQSYLLVAANSVAGYTLHLGTGGVPMDWAMGPREGMVVVQPEPTDEALYAAELVDVERLRLWNLPVQEYDDVVLKARGWSYGGTGPSARAGLEDGSYGFRTGDGSPVPFYLPSADVSLGGGWLSASTASAHVLDPIDLVLFRELRQTMVGPSTTTEGAGFMVIPMDSAR